MRPWWSRRLLAVTAILVTLFGIGAALFSPIVRNLAVAEAARRRLTLRIGGVRPAWWGVTLVDLDLEAEGVPALHATVRRADIGLALNLHIERIEFAGITVRAQGSPDTLSEQLRRWRQTGRASAKAAPANATQIRATGVQFLWVDGESSQPRAEAHDVEVVLGRESARVAAPYASIRAGKWALTVEGISLDGSPTGALQRARVAKMIVRYALGATPPLPAENQYVKTDAAVSSLGSVRTTLASVAELGANWFAPGATLRADALTWQIEPRNDAVAVTIGPGPLSIERAHGSFDIRFSTEAGTGGTPLAVQLLLPLDHADVALSLDGGPISLSLLGIHEGAAGLVDVEKTTTTGRARILLAGNGQALTFDGEGSVQGLSIRNARLALDTVRGLDLDLRARGTASSQGEFRIDDFGVTLGSIQLAAAASLEHEGGRFAGSIRAEIPTTECQALFDSVPAALLPTLHGVRMAGTFGARGHIEFDTRSLDNLLLDYDVADDCHIVQSIDALSPGRFEGPFDYRIRLPDGTTVEETTGPGSDNWTPLDLISPYMQIAVLTTEDGAFLHHHGFNRAAIRSSIIANLERGRFLRGASTITMQLARNLFLSRDKTLSRKLEEVVLTDYLEQTFSKRRLMELYLNVIEFGPAVYGITAAAEHYFGRKPAELNLAESLFLSSILPSPLRLGKMRETGAVPDYWMHLLHGLMETAHRLGRISDAELAAAEEEPVTFWNGVERPQARSPVHADLPIDNEGRDSDVDAMPDLAEDSP